jgi:outer membrane protein
MKKSTSILRRCCNPVTLLVSLILLSTATRAGDLKAPLQITLEKAIALALEQNRDVLIADQDRYKAEAQVGKARSDAFPQINVTGQYTRNMKKPVLFLPPGNPFNPSGSTVAFEIGSDNAYLMGASLSQTLFSRKVGVALDIASTYRDYTEEAFRATKQDVVLQVKKAYYLVLLAQKLVNANRQGLDVVRANFENVQSQYHYGNAAEFDLLRAEVQVANTEPLLISAENTLALSINALRNLLSIPLDQEITVAGDLTFEEFPQEEMNEAKHTALSTNPSILQLSLQESLLEKNISIESANFFPTLSLVGAYQWQAQDNTFQFRNYTWATLFNVGLQLSYTLFDGFKTAQRVQEASVDREKVHYARLKAEEGLSIQIQSAELKMAEAKRRIAGQEKSIDQAQKAVRIAQTRFKSGVGTQLELLDAQVAMTRAQTNYAQATCDYLVAKAEWQYAVGLP